MAKIYARKIHDGAINMSTGEAWKLEDVPMRGLPASFVPIIILAVHVPSLR